MDLMDKLSKGRETTLRDLIIPITMISAVSVGGAVFLSENGGDLARGTYNTAREIFYFLLSDPYRR